MWFVFSKFSIQFYIAVCFLVRYLWLIRTFFSFFLCFCCYCCHFYFCFVLYILPLRSIRRTIKNWSIFCFLFINSPIWGTDFMLLPCSFWVGWAAEQAPGITIVSHVCFKLCQYKGKEKPNSWYPIWLGDLTWFTKLEFHLTVSSVVYLSKITEKILAVWLDFSLAFFAIYWHMDS